MRSEARETPLIKAVFFAREIDEGLTVCGRYNYLKVAGTMMPGKDFR
jgi:hypothetical protein